LERAGSFNCERFDCPQDAGDCSKCGMPKVRRDVVAVLSLWKRCKDWQTLPHGKGVFEQREDVMELLDVVSEEVDRWKALRAEEQRSEMEKLRMGETLNGRR
jgi:hypothetical protein